MPNNVPIGYLYTVVTRHIKTDQPALVPIAIMREEKGLYIIRKSWVTSFAFGEIPVNRVEDFGFYRTREGAVQAWHKHLRKQIDRHLAEIEEIKQTLLTPLPLPSLTPGGDPAP